MRDSLKGGFTVYKFEAVFYVRGLNVIMEIQNQAERQQFYNRTTVYYQGASVAVTLNSSATPELKLNHTYEGNYEITLYGLGGGSGFEPSGNTANLAGRRFNNTETRDLFLYSVEKAINIYNREEGGVRIEHLDEVSDKLVDLRVIKTQLNNAFLVYNAGKYKEDMYVDNMDCAVEILAGGGGEHCNASTVLDNILAPWSKRVSTFMLYSRGVTIIANDLESMGMFGVSCHVSDDMFMKELKQQLDSFNDYFNKPQPVGGMYLLR